MAKKRSARAKKNLSRKSVVSKKRYSKKRYSKKNISKKRGVSKKRYSKKRYSKKNLSKKSVVSKKRYSKKRGGGEEAIMSSCNIREGLLMVSFPEWEELLMEGENAKCGMFNGGKSKKNKKGGALSSTAPTMFIWDVEKTDTMVKMITFFKNATTALGLMITQTYPQIMQCIGYLTASTILSQMESIFQGILYCGIGIMFGFGSAGLLGKIAVGSGMISGIHGLYSSIREGYLQNGGTIPEYARDEIHTRFLCTTTAVRQTYREMFTNMINNSGQAISGIVYTADQFSEFIGTRITEIIVNKMYKFNTGKKNAEAYEMVPEGQQRDSKPLFDEIESAKSVVERKLSENDHWKFNIDVIKLEDQRGDARNMRTNMQTAMTIYNTTKRLYKSAQRSSDLKAKTGLKKSSASRKSRTTAKDKKKAAAINLSLQQAATQSQGLSQTVSQPLTQTQFTFGQPQPQPQQQAQPQQQPMFLGQQQQPPTGF